MNILKVQSNENIKNNYIYLPKEYVDTHSLLDSHQTVSIIKLKKMNSDDIVYLGWMGGISSKEGVIQISNTLWGAHCQKNQKGFNYILKTRYIEYTV